MSLGLDGREDLLERLGGAQLAVGERELDVLVVELLHEGSLAVLVGDGGSADNLDGASAGTVTTGHVVVHGVNSTVQSNISVLTVHVVGARPGVVLQPHAVVLDDGVLLLGDL
jgi:hypothetical protein